MKKVLTKILPVALIAGALVAPAFAGKTFDEVKKKGYVQCGSNANLPGFGSIDTQGNSKGMDVDYCRALAAAVFGDATKVKYSPLSASTRFTALQSGEVDVLSRNTTWTLTRDASLGITFVGVMYYDGQGFIVPKKLNVKSAKQLKNATICVQSGTTTELNMADYFRKIGVTVKPVVFEEHPAAVKAYDEGRCQAFTTDVSGLASVRGNDLKDKNAHIILPEVISKEPLGPAVRNDDPQWAAIARWTLNAMVEAEENGVTSKNIDSMKDSKDPNVKRLVGTGDDMGKLLGLDKNWSYNIIKQVGNYGEVFEANIGPQTPLALERGINQLWSKGGLIYAAPIR